MTDFSHDQFQELRLPQILPMVPRSQEGSLTTIPPLFKLLKYKMVKAVDFLCCNLNEINKPFKTFWLLVHLINTIKLFWGPAKKKNGVKTKQQSELAALVSTLQE